MAFKAVVGVKTSKKWFKTRYLQYFLMSFSLVIFFGMRTALSVSIIAMTRKNDANSNIPTYPTWSNPDTILSSFFWGYFVTQVIGGQLSEWYGPKWFMIGVMILNSVFNFLTPALSACWGSYGIIFCRVMQGLGQGFLYPCIMNMMSKWTPVNERSRVSSFVYNGATVGIITSMLITGALCGSRWGWPASFYLYGILGILWIGIFALFAADSPHTFKWISECEKKYIEANTPHTFKTTSTPWKEIFCSKAVWAIFVASCGASWGSFTLITQIPSYMENVLHFHIRDNSKLSALPYLVLLILCLIGAPIADKLTTTKVFRLGTIRNLFTALGTFLPGVALIGLSFIQNEKNLATVLLVIAVGTSGFTQCGYLVNTIDLCPNYAGTITGFVNSFSTLFSILGPLSVSFFGNDKTNPEVWWNVFRLAAGLYFICGTFYLIFSSGKTQSWNNLSKTCLIVDSDANGEKTDIFTITSSI